MAVFTNWTSWNQVFLISCILKFYQFCLYEINPKSEARSFKQIQIHNLYFFIYVRQPARMEPGTRSNAPEASATGVNPQSLQRTSPRLLA